MIIKTGFMFRYAEDTNNELMEERYGYKLIKQDKKSYIVTFDDFPSVTGAGCSKEEAVYYAKLNMSNFLENSINLRGIRFCTVRITTRRGRTVDYFRRVLSTWTVDDVVRCQTDCQRRKRIMNITEYITK